MKDAQFWNPFLYYLVWYALTIASLSVAVSVWYWERFIGGFKYIVATAIKYLSSAFFLYNAALIVFDFLNFMSGYSLYVSRSASMFVLAAVVAIVPPYIIFRVRRASATERESAVETFELLTMSRRERERAQKIHLSAQAFIHNT